MITVACLLWGDWCHPYGEEYVRKLRDRVDQHLSVPHQFVCFADRDIDDVETIRFEPKYRWNLNKMILYRPDNGLEGRVLALDLDVVPIGSLDDFAAYDGRFAVCESFHPAFSGYAGGSIVGFEAGTLPFLWEDLESNSGEWTDKTEGSERFYYRAQMPDCEFWQRIVPGQIASYKRHCQNGIPHDTRVLCFHGKPRPHERGY